MYKLEVPKVLKRGDTIALISISGGRAGDEDMLYVIPHFIWHQTMPHSTKLKRGTA